MKRSVWVIEADYGDGDWKPCSTTVIFDEEEARAEQRLYENNYAASCAYRVAEYVRK